MRPRDMSVISQQSVDLQLLGHPLVRRGGELIHLPTRNAWLLVARLAVEGPQARDVLAALLWPDADAERGRTNLRRTLLYVRDAFGRDVQSVVGSQQSIALAATVASDVDLVRQALSSTSAVGLLARAVSAWRGDFLEGILAHGEELDLWLTEQRSAWARQLALAAERLVALRSQAGDSAGALQAVDAWLARDPMAEAAHREGIRIHLSRGDRSAALDAYERCASVLARELGLEPDSTTRALGELARSGDVERGEPVQPGPEVPMVGRDHDHSVLGAAFEMSRRGSSTLVLIRGEPGIGKTRLLREFMTWLRPRDAASVSIAAFPSARRLAYHAVSAFLGDVIAATRGVAEPGADLQLFQAAVEHLDSLTRGHTLVLAVDDLQWVDPDSLRLLGFALAELGRRARPLLLLVTVRDEELERRPALREWVAEAGRSLRFEEVVLGPLREADVDRLVELWPQSSVTGAAAAVAKCGGRPLLVVETLRHLAAGGDPTQAAAAVRQAMEARLRGLSPAARQLVGAAAVLERPVALPILARVGGLAPERARAMLTELLRLRVLTGDGAYWFSHELLRETAYAGLSAEDRRALHNAALEALAGTPEASPAELAQHAELAGDLGNALQLRLLAARHALTVAAYRAAADQYRAALAIDPDALEAWLGLGRAEELSDGGDGAGDIYRMLLRRARDSARRDAEAAALIRLAELAGRDLSTDAPLDLLRQAGLAAREAGDETLRLEAELAEAQALSYRTQLARARALARSAPASARRLGDPQLEARALNLGAFISQAQGRWNDALRLARQAVAGYARLNEPLMVLDSLSYEATALVFSGRWAEALTIAEHGVREAMRLGNDWAVCNLSLNEGWALRDGGRLEEALAAAERGADAGRTAGFTPLRLLNEALAGRCKRELGDAASAVEAHMRAIDDARMLKGVVLQSLTEELAADSAALGDWSAAADWAHESLRAASEMRMFVRLSLWVVAEALVRRGDRFKMPPLPGGERYRLVELRTAAALARLAGDSDEEVRHLDSAHRVATALNLPVEVAEITANLDHRVTA